jgi:hypothetical protein
MMELIIILWNNNKIYNKIVLVIIIIYTSRNKIKLIIWKLALPKEMLNEISLNRQIRKMKIMRFFKRTY